MRTVLRILFTELRPLLTVTVILKKKCILIFFQKKENMDFTNLNDINTITYILYPKRIWLDETCDRFKYC